jgi:hypothetical protein
MDASVSRHIDETLKVVKRCTIGGGVADFEELDRLIRNLSSSTREAYQVRLKGEYGYIVDKLEMGQSLTSEEYEVLEMLIVGEAKYYLKKEHDFENWIGDLNRLVSEIESLKRNDLVSNEYFMRLGALCADARILLPGIIFYLRERERVQRFEESTREINESTGKFLASIIKDMLESPNT